MSSPVEKRARRPLSPHLQVWKWTLTMAMSILSRMTGVANALGLLVVVWWLVAAASGPEYYSVFQKFSSSLFGLLLFFGWTLSLYIHMLGGIRHLLMDMGYLFNVKKANTSVVLIWLSAAFLTSITWMCILGTVQ